MKTISKIQMLIIGLFCSAFSNEGAWIIDTDSRLSIHGATNINRFTCTIDSYRRRDTLHYFNNYASSEMQFIANAMIIPIRMFDCGSAQISRDFRNTLKSNLHPDLKIRFISLTGNSIIRDESLKGRMDITLAGVTRRYDVNFKTLVEGKDVILSGMHPVNFGDFNLTAPEKFRGMIRVRDELQVEFHLVLEPI
jgi:hypothetical protein